MNKRKCLLLVNVLGMLSVSVPIVTANSPDAREVLRRFTEARKNFTSFILVTKTEQTFNSLHNWSGKQYHKVEFRFDGVRGRVSTNMWGNVNRTYTDVPEDQPQYVSRLWDEENWYAFFRSVTGSKTDSMKLARSKDPGGVPKKYTEFVQNSMVPGLMMGYNRGDNGKRIEEVLGHASHLKLRQEKLRGVGCYVIDAVVKEKGRYTVWIDPTHDYHIVKLHVLRKEGDYINGKKIPKNNSRDVILEVLRFQQIGDSWFPERYKQRTEVITAKGELMDDTATIDVTNIVLNPDHDALKSFTPYDIPDGTRVRIMAFPPSVKFVWQDGEVVDEDGRKVDYKAKGKRATKRHKK